MKSFHFPHFATKLETVLLLISLINLQCLSLGAISNTTNETDRTALLAFKDRIELDPFHVLSSWNISIHFCQWSGVTCGNKHQQRVVDLSLEGHNLVGSLSPSIGNLTFLRSINLAKNRFHGSIPQEVGRLFRLQYLNLSDNGFSGKIPTHISDCKELVLIHFSGNKFVGQIPVMFGDFPKLNFLYLHENNLTGAIPSSLGNLSSLQALSLLDNNLDGEIPSELGRLEELYILYLSENVLSGDIPPAVYNISSLEYFFFAFNRIGGRIPSDLGFTLPRIRMFGGSGNRLVGLIPSSLSNASQIETIDLADNKLTGVVPASLGSLPRLTKLNLGDNKLISQGGINVKLGFFSSLINSSTLEVLALEMNQFTGELPNLSVNFTTNLQSITMGDNRIHGKLPTSIGNLVKLKVLAFENCNLTGEIPDSIGKLKDLTQLFLSSNSLSGKIPSSIGNLTSLSELYLNGNRLQGSIPSSLGNCLELQALTLAHNNLNGTIPGTLLSISSLSILVDLSHNSLSGILPSQVSRLINLGELYLSGNRLSGEIPSTLGECAVLRYLFLNGNSFEGSIPQSLKELRGLQELDLSDNKLTGKIPEFFGRLPFLYNLNLSFNDLEGKIPEEGVFKNASALSVTGNRNLCGGVSTLRLPVCVTAPPPYTVASMKHRRTVSLKVILSVVIVSICIILLIMYFIVRRFCRSRNKPTSTALFDQQKHSERISYAELLQATNGFSSENLIGSGGFGSVYKGILSYNGSEKVVAVKVLDLQKQGASKTFMAECSSLRNIRHRNLVKILTVCSGVDYKGNDFKALVFEFMANGNLEDWLHPTPLANEHNILRNLSLLQRLNIAIDVASAVDYLHHHCLIPIVHRDLKPSNILLDNDMNAHVGDFGLAKFLPDISNSSGQMSSTAMVKGSIGYIAPEYAMGGKASIQGDIYSFGIVLLEMITGKRPTEDMFEEGINLHNFSKALLSEDRVMESVDQRLMIDGGEHGQETINNDGKLKECLYSVLEVGVACSVESPGERSDISDIVMELAVIRDVIQQVVVNKKNTQAVLELV
ncbi:hypothetical protein MKW94_019255 [Papaver nudicaule]|uniref:non-specific serine/threonine protein kinase n=1 Tax=Papaver nudicaule TaxID=74823 RepID=A0AA41RVC8_PAPNU|nr:hypothetical protein [Papaver nudicaule]